VTASCAIAQNDRHTLAGEALGVDRLAQQKCHQLLMRRGFRFRLGCNIACMGKLGDGE
jgi:hypothetical protein